MGKHGALAGIALAMLLVAGGGSLFAQNAGHTAAGALVAVVAAGSPADKAGIARGDIILSVGDKDVNTPREVLQALNTHKAGDSVALKISHGDATRTLALTLGTREGRPYLGIMLAPTVADGAPRSGAQGVEPAPFGALVTEVNPGSPAAQAGLQAGDVVVGVDGTSLDAGHSLTELIAREKPGDTVTLSVASRGGQPRDLNVTLAQNPARTDSAYLGVSYRPVSSRSDRRRPSGRPLDQPM